MRDLVIEGSDGAGKSTLVESLAAHGLRIHRRASDSIKGPVSNLDGWVEQEFRNRYRRYGVYDRHPVISEPIYGPICRGRMPGKFNDRAWLIQARGLLAETSYVIWCEPPFSTVMAAITANSQMSGVVDHAYQLYQAYILARKSWLGPSTRYDWTTHASEDIIAHALERRLG